MSALPKIDLPRYKHTLQGLGKEITYRGFTAKEQKILLQAKESKDESQVREAIKQIVELCVYDDINVDELPFFDIEDLFLRLRSKSVSNKVDMTYRVKDKDGNATKEKVDVSIDLDKVQVTFPEGHNKKIQLGQTIGVMMTYPSLPMIDSKTDMFGMIKDSIDFIYNEDEVFYLKDHTDEEIDDFIDSLDTEAMKKMQKFFETMPRLRHVETVTLPDGDTIELEFEGLSDFFQ